MFSVSPIIFLHLQFFFCVCFFKDLNQHSRKGSPERLFQWRIGQWNLTEVSLTRSDKMPHSDLCLQIGIHVQAFPNLGKDGVCGDSWLKARWMRMMSTSAKRSWRCKTLKSLELRNFIFLIME